MVVLGVTSNARSDSSPSYGLAMAEGVGFEPTVSCPTPVFKLCVTCLPTSTRIHTLSFNVHKRPLASLGIHRVRGGTRGGTKPYLIYI